MEVAFTFTTGSWDSELAGDAASMVATSITIVIM
jgi:hypothetical protein